MTVRMVPSTGFAMAEYAESDARTTASAKSSVVTRGRSGSPSEKPQKNCARIAPELPRVPLADARDARGDLLERRGDVGSRVAVRNREHVDLVQALRTVRNEAGSRDDRAGKAPAVQVADRDHGVERTGKFTISVAPEQSAARV